MAGEIETLTTGPIHWFQEWPTGELPRTGAAVYTIWHRDGRFIYVGMSGRGYSEGSTRAGSSGPWGRIASHASGRRSGDQFCVCYVADRLVLPGIHNRLGEIAAGSLSIDAATKEFIAGILASDGSGRQTAHPLL